MIEHATTWRLTVQLGDLIADLYRDNALTLDDAYRQSWKYSYDPTGYLEPIESVLFLLGASTLDTHCEDCAGLREDEGWKY